MPATSTQTRGTAQSRCASRAAVEMKLRELCEMSKAAESVYNVIPVVAWRRKTFWDELVSIQRLFIYTHILTSSVISCYIYMCIYVYIYILLFLQCLACICIYKYNVYDIIHVYITISVYINYIMGWWEIQQMKRFHRPWVMHQANSRNIKGVSHENR